MSLPSSPGNFVRVLVGEHPVCSQIGVRGNGRAQGPPLPINEFRWRSSRIERTGDDDGVVPDVGWVRAR
jgi:hypothetical protein